MTRKHSNNVFSSQYPSGIVFVGVILIGMGVGILKHETGPYTLISIGIGFVLVAIISMLKHNKFLDR